MRGLIKGFASIKSIKKEIEKKRLSDSGLISNIRYEGDNETIVFKHPIEDFRNGSQLTVHSSQEAVFFRDGEALDILKAGRYALETQNLPIMDKMYKIPTDGTPFHAEVYFVNMTTQMGVKWGTPDKVKFIEPISEAPISIGARGTLNYRVVNSKKLLLKLVGTTDGLKRSDIMGDGKSYAKDYFRPLIQTSISTNLVNAIKQNSIDILQIDQERLTLSQSLTELVTPYFEDYGIEITELLVEGIVLPVRGELGYDAIQTLYDLRRRKLKESEIQNTAALKQAELETEKLLEIQREKNRAEAEVSRRERELAERETQKQRDDYEREKIVKDAAAKADAERVRIQQELDAKERLAEIEAKEMRAKGYTQKDVILGDVLKTFGENPGEGSASAVRGFGSEAMGAGLSLGVMGTAAGVAQDVLNNGMQAGMNVSNAILGQNGWTCQCGQCNSENSKFCSKCGTAKEAGNSIWICPQCGTNNTGNYCTSCRMPRPITWDCTCGQKCNTGAFCSQCGEPRPAMAEEWTCPICGKSLISNACPDCGERRPSKKITVDRETWTCPNCGMKNLSSKCCPECGEKRPTSSTPWTCPNCKKRGITSKCCPDCGQKRPLTNMTWTCPNCGKTEILSKCCPDCGTKQTQEVGE